MTPIFSPEFKEGLDVERYGLFHSKDSNKSAKIIPFKGGPAIEFSLDRLKDKVIHRTELNPKNLPSNHFDQGLYARFGKSYHYSVSIFTPKDWSPDTLTESIVQWHSRPDKDEENLIISPPLALYVGSSQGKAMDRYWLRVRAIKDNPPKIKSGKVIYDIDSEHNLGKIIPGTWERWRFEIAWDYSKFGFTSVFRNGKRIVTLRQPNCMNDKHGPYWKFGIYKWDWKKGKRGPVTSRKYYYKDIKISAE